MNRSVLVLLLLPVILLSGGRSAAAEDLLVYLQGGWALPADPPEFGDLWNTAPSFGGGIGLRLSPEWELVGSLHVQEFPADEAAHIRELQLQSPTGEVYDIRELQGRDARVVTLMAELRFHIATRFPRTSPFLGFGVGYFDLSVSPSTVAPDAVGITPRRLSEETDSALGTSVGGGIGFQVSRRVRFVVDSVYTIGFTDGLSTQFLPFRLGLAIG